MFIEQTLCAMHNSQHFILMYFIFTTILWASYCYYPHFTDEENQLFLKIAL